MTVDEAKVQLRLVDSEDDGYVQTLIEAATAAAERETHRAIGVQEIEATVGTGFIAAALRLPLAPHLALVSASDIVGEPSAVVVVPEGERLDVIGDSMLRTVRYLAGYGRLADAGDSASLGDYTCDAPADVKQAILITVADLYENRSSVVVGTIASGLPLTARSLLFSYILFD